MTLVGPSDNVENADTLFKLTKITRHATIAFNNPNLAKGSQFIFATHGKLNITKVSPEAIHGKFLAKFDKENFANGQFKAELCKYGQLN